MLLPPVWIVIREETTLQANYRITNNLTFGVESGYRFIKSDPRPSNNVYGYLTYYQVPGLNVSITLNGTYLESAYMNGTVLGANISKGLYQGRIHSSIGYSYTNYSLSESKVSILQNVAEMSFYWQFSKKKCPFR